MSAWTPSTSKEKRRCRGATLPGSASASSSPKDTQDSTSAKAGSPPSTDTEEACARKRKINTEHNWVSVRKDDDGGPLQFEGFSAAYAFMHQEFAAKGCYGMTLVDRGSDTTKYCVVYRYACAFHIYIKCPFLVRIRVLVLSVSWYFLCLYPPSVFLCLCITPPLPIPPALASCGVWHAGTGG